MLNISMLYEMLLQILRNIIYILNRLRNSDTASEDTNMRNVGLLKVKPNYKAC